MAPRWWKFAASIPLQRRRCLALRRLAAPAAVPVAAPLTVVQKRRRRLRRTPYRIRSRTRGRTRPIVQAGAFSDPANAERLAAKLRGGKYGTVFVRDDQIAGRKMYRVRIGPVPDVAHFDRVVAALEQAGVKDAHLALD